MFVHSDAENSFRWRLVVLFYISLFITGFVFILVLFWLYRMIVSYTQRIYRTRIPNAVQSPTGHLNEQKYGKNSKLASKAWGGKPHATPANLARTHPANAEKPAPWGLPGHEHEIYGHQPRVAATKGATLNAYLAREKLKHQTEGS